jgi:ribosome recycling factor
MDSKYMSDLTAGAERATEFFEAEIGNIHTGRATTSLVSEVLVDAYGTKSPLKQVANITVTDSRSLAIQPWDKGNLVQIESALREANLGFGVVNSGDAIRINIPELTEERRNEFVKMVKAKAEEAKISIRNIRRDIWEAVKKDKTSGDITEDEINKFVEAQNKRIDDVISTKEKELREV